MLKSPVALKERKLELKSSYIGRLIDTSLGTGDGWFHLVAGRWPVVT